MKWVRCSFVMLAILGCLKIDHAYSQASQGLQEQCKTGCNCIREWPAWSLPILKVSCSGSKTTLSPVASNLSEACESQIGEMMATNCSGYQIARSTTLPSLTTVNQSPATEPTTQESTTDHQCQEHYQNVKSADGINTDLIYLPIIGLMLLFIASQTVGLIYFKNKVKRLEKIQNETISLNYLQCEPQNHQLQVAEDEEAEEANEMYAENNPNNCTDEDLYAEVEEII